MELHSFTTTDASQTIFLEGMARNLVNNNAREVMGALARFDRDNDGSLTTGGTTTAYTVTLNSQHSAWFNGLRFRAKVNAASGATPTINPTGSSELGAKSLYWGDGTQVNSDLPAGVFDFVYLSSPDKVYVLGSKANVSGPASSTDNALARFDGTGGKTLQDSSFATLSDAGALVVSGTAASADLQRSAAAPYLYLSRTDTHGDAAAIALIGAYGKDDAAAAKRYNFINFTAISDAAGSETGRVEIGGRYSGTDASRVLISAGVVIGAATGGDQGVGTGNATALYENGRRVYPAGCWGSVTYSAGTPTLNDSHNVTGITDTATGRLTVTIATDHANDDYAAGATAVQSAAAGKTNSTIVSKAVGSFEVTTILSDTGSSSDPLGIDFYSFGDI